MKNLQNGSVKGILRESGTPGSGNGGEFNLTIIPHVIVPKRWEGLQLFKTTEQVRTVRFFPKNRFRVITPNQSLHEQAPPSPSSTSFLAQLLAVVPIMSPRRAPTRAIQLDDSWEVPGQEGEISLVASSATSLDKSRDLSIEQEEDEDEAESWTGQPTIHSSPLGLHASLAPAERSMDHDASRSMVVPEDMSNLMSEKLSMSGFDSFSLGPTRRKDDSSIKETSFVASTSMSNEFSLLSTLRPNRIAPPPTDRDHSLGDLATQAPLASAAPAPATPLRDTRPSRSIFADMSAEQADLSWPLVKRSPEKAIEGETAFHSAISRSPGLGSPGEELTPFPRPELANTPGNATTFYDCPSDAPSPVFHSSSSFNSLELRTPSPTSIDLIQPTKAMFEAHSAHTAALATELELHQRLVQSLQDEVSQRDAVLAKLNVQALEAEVWHGKYDELLCKLKMSEEQTPSPTPNRTAASDRTTTFEASNRDLEIRLSKALVEQRDALGELERVKVDRDLALTQLDAHQKETKETEQRHRGVLKQVQSASEDLRQQLEAVSRRERVLQGQLAEAREEARSIGDQARDVQGTVERDSAEREKEKDREIARLLHALDLAEADRTAARSSQQTLAELQTDLVAERKAKERAMARLQGANEARMQTELEKQDVSLDLVE